MAAEQHYKKALQLNPNYPSAHQYYALGLMAHGRFAKAEAQLEIARRLDPLALIVEVDAGLPDAQRAQYLNGEGMGFAKPAELNHYPGPRHILQIADRLKLSPEQLSGTQELFDKVQERAKELGRQIVNREDELTRLFSSHIADEARIQQLTAEISQLEGELRAAHLIAHLKERSLLSTEQVRIYDEARDYIPGEKPAPMHQH